MNKNNNTVKATFLLAEQKEHLHKLANLLTHIESCNSLGEIDPAYYGQKKQEYIAEYQMQLNQLLRKAKAVKV